MGLATGMLLGGFCSFLAVSLLARETANRRRKRAGEEVRQILNRAGLAFSKEEWQRKTRGL